MKQHFVELWYGGTFLHESETYPIDEWDVELALVLINKKITKPCYPFGFQFITRSRRDDELDSHVSTRSGMYFLGGQLKTYEQIVDANDPNERTLRTNMRVNNIKHVVVNDNWFRVTLPFKENDTMLEWSPPSPKRSSK